MFAKTLAEGRDIYRSKIEKNLAVPPLLPLVTKAPYRMTRGLYESVWALDRRNDHSP